jgi:hypothetical protein
MEFESKNIVQRKLNKVISSLCKKKIEKTGFPTLENFLSQQQKAFSKVSIWYTCK